MEKDPNVHVLVYGVEDSFVYEHAEMYRYTQKELWDAVKAAGGALVQAHPYRREVNRLLDTAMLDGVEVNCHPLYKYTHRDEMAEIAVKNNLALTCGGDYHGGSVRVRCGMYLPDDIKDTYDIAKYLETTDSVRLCVQDVGEDTPHDVVFERNN
jgi:hypothetical protein